MANKLLKTSVPLLLFILTQNAFAVDLPNKAFCAWYLNTLGGKQSELPRISRLKLAQDLPTLSDHDLLTKVVAAYPEMIALTGAVNASPDGIMKPTESQFASEKLFGKKHPEFDRTYTGILVLKWILAGDYAKLTSVQKPEVKLSEQSFRDLQVLVKKVLPDAQAIDAMITSMVINDLGKIKAFVEKAKHDTGIEDVDHDKILLVALQKNPSISPSFMKLSPRYRNMILKGLEAEFNFGQFVQAESVAGSLFGLKSLVQDQQALDFYLVHALVDISGAAGHINQGGSIILTEATNQNFDLGIKAIEGLARGETPKQVYEKYLELKGQTYGLDHNQIDQRAAIRLACMLRTPTAQEARRVLDVLNTMPTNTKNILLRELNLSGVDDGFASLVYYSPAMLSNVKAALEKAQGPNSFHQALEIGLTTLARVYQEARINLRGRSGNGVYTVLISSVAEAAKDPLTLGLKEFELEKVGDGAQVKVTERPVIKSEVFPKIQSLQEIPGKNIGVIGIGGGSDGIQAAMLGKLLETNSKSVPFVISIRTAVTGSQGASGKVGENRSVVNHGGEIFPGVYKVTTQTTGSGRFLENLPAAIVPMYLVMDLQNGTLQQQIEAVVKHVGGVDTVVAVDTGGDALYSAVKVDSSKATPDQDLRVLRTLSNMQGVNLLTAEIAAGVDSPRNAQQVLQSAQAQYYTLSPAERSRILSGYAQWGMDGRDESRFGKTPLAWQSALNGQHGMQSLPLPSRVVLDTKNPWNPFVYIAESMSGIFFMNVRQHLSAIRANGHG